MTHFDLDDVQVAGFTEARHNAEQVWKEHGEKSIPVDLIKIIKSIGLERHKTTELPAYVKGICIEIEPGRGGIAYKEGSPQSKKWIVAHEIGHWCMGHVSSFGEPIGKLPEHQEQEADTFAGALLIPQTDLLIFCKQTKPSLSQIQQRYAVTANEAAIAIKRPGILKYISAPK
ncbi:MAG: ImmA/IrrE family metallo-endopeptidase [Candidatus Peribacteraceae bacterium]|nr:ImmA/IrrE family metallo-endopeptidase [Candidatus Peribacteraceae bacterium]MDD5739295.1 ImmA/IrrE family metallo-endopeptidase [Candidatus Peribacteraceae bacterium]